MIFLCNTEFAQADEGEECLKLTYSFHTVFNWYIRKIEAF